MKTRKVALKRFKLTGKGKILSRHSHRGHLMSKKSGSRKRRLAVPTQVTKGDARQLRKLLPHF